MQEVAMLKQSGPASRNQRYKHFKVKHVLQICVLLALCIWLLNQAKSTSDNKVSSENGVVKLGRKELNPPVQSGVEDENMIEGERAETEEEIEDLIDEEDREQENQIEDLSLMAMNESEGDESLEEEKRKGEDASTISVLVNNNFDTTQTAAQE